MTGIEEIHLPRFQVGTPPQHLITTLLGDYWFRREEPLPSAALVRLAEEFGVSSVAARAALSRLARRDLLESSKAGRRTYYRITDRAAEVLSEGRQRIMSFGLHHGAWDEQWTVAGFSIPEEQRDLRHALRTRLRWLGFAPLYDGLWVSPAANAAAAVAALAELGVTNATVFRATAADAPGLRAPHDAWDFALLRRSYDQFIERYEPLLGRVREGAVGAAEALVARTGVMDTWRTFPNLDPGLPAELLPADWPRARARDLFVEIYDTLGPLAEIRVKQIVAEFDPALARLVHHHRAGTILAAAT
ncbi:phenylacetic acid degradation operon negative regulatory protein [Thermocatellispora tengchongensis]|uniref:Phenylacetic acid degradation operon negative regulatory protein n=1 Tax=Thermocatellispora tengchongensis TaxID=1073253 RepID=A0A840P4K5_9ACTN|nr:PaaX family transcriptional regulator C-terminal domain-containing protein [Thermocatellispora tengchongensis]MBB5134292.1 phenylacetic acid degradation operon negative regulatory protein [Thermocatellispora tengchongensis]